MSYQPVPPARHRSSSAVRSSSRPRSMGFYNTNPYSSSNAYNSSSSSLYSTPYSAASSSYSSPYSANSYASPYTSNYKSPYFSNGYRTPSTNSGYASLTIPAKALSNLNITPSNYKSGLSTRDYMKSSSHRSRRDASLSRGSSFNRDRSMSRSQSVNSGLGSKSISLTSLNSEGYVSGTEKSSRSRLGSTNDVRNENGEIDYKKLYEEAMVENKRLKDKLKKSDDELRDTKQTLEKLSVASKNSISELEKREKRSMERKLSEMEEELKHLENLKSENQRLKDENGALIRVISKLSK